MTAFDPALAARIAATDVPLTADLAPLSAGRIAETQARLIEARRIRQGRNGELGPVVKALHDTADLLESEQWKRRRLGVATTDYTLLMRACYGPLFTQTEHSGRWGLVPRSQRPAGALEAARAVTAEVVKLLGGESGATVQDIRDAINRQAGGSS